MQKNKTILALSAAGVALAFGLIAFLVWLSRGKNAALIKSKLKVGALLIALTTAFSSSSCTPEVMCYMPAPLFQIHIASPEDLQEDGSIQMSLSTNSTINGTVEHLSLQPASYAIFPVDSVLPEDLIQSGDIEPLDGETDSTTEEFAISVSDISPGNYELRIYRDRMTDVQDFTNFYLVYPLQIIE